MSLLQIIHDLLERRWVAKLQKAVRKKKLSLDEFRKVVWRHDLARVVPGGI